LRRRRRGLVGGVSSSANRLEQIAVRCGIDAHVDETRALVRKRRRKRTLELPFVSEARYVGRYGWVTASIEDEPAFDAVCEWIRESYWLKAPKDLRESAWS